MHLEVRQLEPLHSPVMTVLLDVPWREVREDTPPTAAFCDWVPPPRPAPASPRVRETIQFEPCAIRYVLELHLTEV